ncbi:MAG: SDR family NAD(P)-dependent oxidoreductase [Chloroflexi bacterium]|nr:MAG: SDR family NAD(P)-dependent oxidoreductase [Chloroflexota bacterium]
MSQRKIRVVVTGGAGFIGSHLIDRLLADDNTEVLVLDNLSRGRLTNLARWQGNPRLDVVQADVRDAQSFQALLYGSDIVYHLAAQSTVMGAVNDLGYTFSTNVVGTFNVLTAAAHHGVRRVVFTSSREVYGEPISLPVDEESPLLAANSYGASKAAGEAYCRAFRREFGLQTAVLRLANVYGPRDFGRVIPPLSIPFALSCVLLVATLALALAGHGGTLPLALAACSLVGQVAYLLAALALVRAPRSRYVSLGKAPIYIAWKVSLYARALLPTRGSEWVRTSRAPTTAAC